eukprot:6321287-Pyramimonas_sp.AAC.1
MIRSYELGVVFLPSTLAANNISNTRQSPESIRSPQTPAPSIHMTTYNWRVAPANAQKDPRQWAGPPSKSEGGSSSCGQELAGNPVAVCMQ